MEKFWIGFSVAFALTFVASWAYLALFKHSKDDDDSENWDI